MTTYNVATNAREGSRVELEAPLMPARAFFYAVVEEVGQNGFLVRKVYEVLDETTLRQAKLPLEVLENEMFPEIKGINYRAPDSNISIARHVMGSKISKYMSSSGLFPDGSPRLNGRITYIDIEKGASCGRENRLASRHSTGSGPPPPEVSAHEGKDAGGEGLGEDRS